VADHASRFIDHSQIGIFIENIERDFFGKGMIVDGLGFLQVDSIIQPRQITGFGIVSVYADIAFPNPVLNLGAALAGNAAQQELVQTGVRGIGRNNPGIDFFAQFCGTAAGRRSR
jgi:hypothetical protein